jgi:hypothetical protein
MVTPIVDADMPDSPNNLPGRGFLGWLGRQVGHVAKAVKTDVAGSALPASPAAAEPTVVYRTDTVTQAPHPTKPGVVLRRTVVDEIVVTAPKTEPGGSAAGSSSTAK